MRMKEQNSRALFVAGQCFILCAAMVVCDALATLKVAVLTVSPLSPDLTTYVNADTTHQQLEQRTRLRPCSMTGCSPNEQDAGCSAFVRRHMGARAPVRKSTLWLPVQQLRGPSNAGAAEQAAQHRCRRSARLSNLLYLSGVVLLGVPLRPRAPQSSTDLVAAPAAAGA